jgi:polyhydroxyalkanoate synthesis regulator phasin
MAKTDFSDIPYALVGATVAVQEEMIEAADRLVDKGKSLTPEGRKKMAGARKGLVSKGNDFSMVVARTVQRVLENAGIVTRGDLDKLDHRVDALEKKLAAPTKKPGGKTGAGKPAARKKASGKPAARKKAASASARKSAGKQAGKAAEQTSTAATVVPEVKPVEAPAAEPLRELITRPDSGQEPRGN